MYEFSLYYATPKAFLLLKNNQMARKLFMVIMSYAFQFFLLEGGGLVFTVFDILSVSMDHCYTRMNTLDVHDKEALWEMVH